MNTEPSVLISNVEARVHHDPSLRNTSSTSSQADFPLRPSDHNATQYSSTVSRDATLELEGDCSDYTSESASTDSIGLKKRGSIPTKSRPPGVVPQENHATLKSLMSDSEANMSDVHKQPSHRPPQLLDVLDVEELGHANQHNIRANPRKRLYPDYVSSGPENEDLDPLSNDEVQSKTAPPPPSRARVKSLEHGRRSSTSGSSRLIWDFDVRSVDDNYIPQLQGRWWSKSAAQWPAMGEARRAHISHVGRIMETDLGKQLLGNDRCARCIESNDQCWVYSRRIEKTQIGAKFGQSCARCLFKGKSCVRPVP